MPGRLYTAQFNAVAVSAAQDLFELAAAANVSLIIHGWEIGQATDYGDAQAEGARLLLIRGHTTTGSGGSTVTPGNMVQGSSASVTTAKANNTTPASGGTPVTLFATAFNIQIGHEKWFTPETRPIVSGGSRIVLNLPNTPADPFTMSGTLFFEEV